MSEVFETFLKGHIAIGKVISDLIGKGYQVFIPVTDQRSVDLVVIINDKPLRLQAAQEQNAYYVVRPQNETQKAMRDYAMGNIKSWLDCASDLERLIV